MAGDLLPADDPAARIEALTATGFLSLGAKMLAEDDPVKMQMDIVDEQLDTIGRAFMGLTMGCARCHDHKFDPIPQADYYSLAGILKSTKTMENFNVVARWQERPLATPEAVQQRESHQKKVDAKKSEIQRITDRANKDLLAEARQHVADYLIEAAKQRRRDQLLKTAKPFGDEPKAKDIRGLTIIEAENFDRGNVLKDSTSYGKSIGVLVNAGKLPNFVEYDLKRADAGLCQIELRYAAASSRPCKLSINGKVVKADAAGKVTGSWYPDTQKWFVEGFFHLQPGKNTIRLEHPQYFPHIDKLLVVPVRPANLDHGTGGALLSNTAGQIKNMTKPAFVRQWVTYLERTRNDPKSPLAAWHAFVKDPKPNPSARLKGLSGPAASLFKNYQPKSARELADRYQQLFAEAHRAWQALKSSDAGKDAKSLPDQVQESLRKVLYDSKGPFALPKDAEESYPAKTIAELKRKREELKALEKSLPNLPLAMSVSDGKIEDLPIHIRGNHRTLGEKVPRRFLRIIAGENQTPVDAKQSGRLQLARWLTGRDHPLTSRVMANRIWQGHFGEGLVRSPDNFGRLGQRPTHPELLDWLAIRFTQSGWSIKALHRLIMLSSTYQMSAAYSEQAAALDPENRLCWRMNRRRLDAESIRDAILAVCGTLDLTMGGTMLPTKNRAYVTSTANVNPVVYETNRRSIYLPVVRSALFEVFQAFDFADPSVLNGKRVSTTVAPQALFMMNSKFVSQQTKAMAQSLLANSNLDEPNRVRRIYERAYSRTPTQQETTRALKYIDKYTEAFIARKAQPGDARLRAWQSVCRAILASNEFFYTE